MEKKSKKQLKAEEIVKNLTSSDIKTIEKALQNLQTYGVPEIIPELVKNLSLESNSDEKDRLILEFLNSLKDTDSVPVLIDVLKNPEYRSKRQVLLTTIWNSPLDYSNYLSYFVQIALEGDFMETLECLTIIENFEGPFNEKSIYESKLLISNFIENQSVITSQKKELLSEIINKLNEFEEIADSDELG